MTWSVCHCLAQYSCDMLHGVCAIVWHNAVVLYDVRQYSCDMECVPLLGTVQLRNVTWSVCHCLAQYSCDM